MPLLLSSTSYLTAYSLAVLCPKTRRKDYDCSSLPSPTFLTPITPHWRQYISAAVAEILETLQLACHVTPGVVAPVDNPLERLRRSCNPGNEVVTTVGQPHTPVNILQTYSYCHKQSAF